MFQALMNIIINLCATIVQLVMLPFNTLLYKLLPDLSGKIVELNNLFGNVFNSMSWALGLVPLSLLSILLFIVSIEVIKTQTYISTKAITKVWALIQKLKFW